LRKAEKGRRKKLPAAAEVVAGRRVCGQIQEVRDQKSEVRKASILNTDF
jgi:hypothetical protein